MSVELETPPDHTFKVREKVYILDTNGYDIWEGVIKSIDGNEFTISNPEYPKNSGQKISDLSRIFPVTKVNYRIFHEQEMKRSERAAAEDDDDDFKNDDDGDDYGSEASEKEEDFAPDDDDFGGKKKKKAKKLKKKEPQYHPRPAGARSNPPRGSSKK